MNQMKSHALCLPAVGGRYPPACRSKADHTAQGDALWGSCAPGFQDTSIRKEPFIRLRRRPRALPVDECVRGVGANPEPRYHCFGGFRHWRITLRSLGACVPKRFGAHGRRRVFLWRYHGLSPWGSISDMPRFQHSSLIRRMNSFCLCWASRGVYFESPLDISRKIYERAIR